LQLRDKQNRVARNNLNPFEKETYSVSGKEKGLKWKPEKPEQKLRNDPN
jgi:hypothetical protein